MKKILSIILVSLVFFSKGQNLEIPAFGSDSTFEMITWNIEWFPKNGETTVNYVSEIIGDLEVDLIAMQELDDTIVFNQMISELENYNAYYESGYFAGLAYIYNPEVVQIDTIYEIYTTQPYWRPFPRSPMVMELTFMYDTYIVINNHFKCCGDGYLDMDDQWDEEKRRYDASNLLEEYIRLNFQDKKVIFTGDLNDDIAEASPNNVFTAFLDSPEEYLFTDMDIALGPISNWSYPTWPSHLDHILITEPLFADMLNEGSVTETLLIDQYFDSWYDYDANVSDHRPVAIRIDGDYHVGWEQQNKPESSLIIYPNPTSGNVNIAVNKPHGLKGKINVYSFLGVRLESFDVSNSDNILSWEPENNQSGFYFIELSLEGEVVSKKRVIVTR